jgi:hypothetical protein
MGFVRTQVDNGSRLAAPSRAGVGFLANVTPTNFNTESDETITVAQLSGGSINQGLTLTSDVIYTLPTAALIIAEWPEMDVGDSYTFYVGNSQAAAFDVVMAVGAGITAIGTNNNLSIAPQAGKMFTLTKTSATTMDLY